MEQLWQMLTLRPDGEEGGELLLTAPDQGQPTDRVFGGLLLAQAVAAAGHDLPAGVVPLALNADFLSGVPVTGSNTWRVRALGGGRRMATRRVSLLDEHGDVGFTATVRLGEVRADLPSYRTVTPRQVPGPDGLVPLAERYGGDERLPAWWRIRRPVDLRHVEPPTFLTPVPERASEQSLWWRLDDGEVVGDPVRTAAVMAYASDMSLIEPAFRMTGSARHAGGSRILSLTHTMAFHELVDLTGWVQMDCAVPSLAHGRALGVGEMHVAGRHVASMSQLALVKLSS